MALFEVSQPEPIENECKLFIMNTYVFRRNDVERCGIPCLSLSAAAVAGNNAVAAAANAAAAAATAAAVAASVVRLLSHTLETTGCDGAEGSRKD
jgi:hypothetical protein